MELFGEFFIWMSLDTQRFMNREDFEEKRQFSLSKLLSDFGPEERRIGREDFRKWLLRVLDNRWIRRMCSHPQLQLAFKGKRIDFSIWFSVIDREIRIYSRASRSSRIFANFPLSESFIVRGIG